jgi:hydroxymethylpyrimidine kinase/phosphomethylpyrimidine kinase/thiamine-phosphate diphosphorylase
MTQLVWTIAGSDAGGGAGIQADIKAMASFEVHAATVITALTAQNSLGVLSINAVSLPVLAAQLAALEQDKLPLVIKIGLLANVEQVNFISAKIAQYKKTWLKPPCVIYDPVAVASSGDSLVEQNIIPAIKSELFPLVDVLTPNCQETQRLTGVYLLDSFAMVSARKQFIKQGIKKLIIKGGHWHVPQGYCVDYGFDTNEEYWLATKNITTMHSHGSGCTFAAALAACLAKGYPFKDSFLLAKAYINQGLKAAKQLAFGEGCVAHLGFPLQLDDFPEVVEINSRLGKLLALNELYKAQNVLLETKGFPACCHKVLGLYAIVDSIDWLQLCLEQGIKTLQLRLKEVDESLLHKYIEQGVSLAKKYQAQLFINDYWQLAIKYQAYGVHLGQEDLQQADLQAIKKAGLRLGISTHGFYELIRAHQYQPSYLAIGAIFATSTKEMSGQIQGLEKLRYMVKLITNIPTVAIGGITIARAKAVLATDISSIAVVSAITKAEKPKLAIEQLITLVKKT